MKIPNRRAILALGLMPILVLANCAGDGLTPPQKLVLSRSEVGVWIATEPTQCLTNPWEQDWLASNDDDYAGYPKDPPRPGLEPEELAIVVDYYARQGVVVFEATTRVRFDAVCDACSCPEGHTMFLLVRSQDVATMVRLGYRVEFPLK